MSTQTQIRRDTATNLNAATPAAGELGADLTNLRLRLGNGLLLGGMNLPNQRDMIGNPWNSGTTSGTDTYTMALLIPLVALAAGQQFDVKIGTTNTTSATLNIDSSGAKGIKKRDSTGALIDVAAGDLRSGNVYQLWYDGTVYQILGGLAAASSNETFILSQSASNSAQIDFTLPGGYDYYRVDIKDWNTSTDLGTMRLNLGGGIITSGYASNGDRLTMPETLAGYDYNAGLSSSSIAIAAGINSTGLRGTVWVYPTQTTAIRRAVVWDMWAPPSNISSGQVQRGRGVGSGNGNGDITQIRFRMDSLNIPTGTFKLTGIKNA